MSRAEVYSYFIQWGLVQMEYLKIKLYCLLTYNAISIKNSYNIFDCRIQIWEYNNNALVPSIETHWKKNNNNDWCRQANYIFDSYGMFFINQLST